MAGCLAARVSTAAPRGFRGLWVVRHSIATPERAADVARRAREAGFNALLVQARGRGDAYYASRIVPAGEDVSPGFDPLAFLVEAGHREGLEVHAWFNVFLAWYRPDRRPLSSFHVLVKHPDWFVVSHDGRDSGDPDLPAGVLQDRGVEGRYLSPSLPEVREHLLEVVEELAQDYAIDGLHLDYVRYPNADYDYRASARAEFARDYGVDPLRLPSGRDAAEHESLWREWRAERVSDCVGAVRALTSRVRPGLKLSAAVKPDLTEAYEDFGQDWQRWLSQGWIDFAVPMLYTGSTEQIAGEMREVRRARRKGHIYAGIGAWNRSPVETAALVAEAGRAGMGGVVVFSYETLLEQPSLGSVLRQGPFRDSPERSSRRRNGEARGAP